jgi:hypothetical protein
MSLNFVIPEFNIGGAGTPPLQFFRRGFNINGSNGGGSWTDIILKGNTALTLVNAKANGLNYLKLFGGTEQRNLPIGYTQYEYLRSSGTQYIDLGYKGNGNTKVKIKFRYHTATSATGSGRVFGSRITSSTDAFAIGTSSGIVSSEGTNKVFWCYDGQPYFVDDTNFGLDEWKTVVFSATEHTIDGVTVGDDYTVTEFETPTNLKLFGFDNNGTVGVGYVDIAFCQLWEDDVLVRDVVPCSNGTAYGMYDFVSGAMLPNTGTGTFEVGLAIVPTPDEPINIISNNGAIKYSANMCNVNEQTALVGYFISNSGVVTADANNWIYQDYIQVKPNTTYTLTMSTSVYYVTISEYSTADDSGFVRRNAGSSGDNTTLTITTGSNTNYIRFGTNIDRSQVTLDRVLAINWMLNVGDTMAYQPYVEGSIYTDGNVETVEVGSLFDSVDGQGTFVVPSLSNTTRIYKAFGQLPNGEYKVSITGSFEFIFQYKDAMESHTQYGNIGTWTTNGVYDLDTTGYYYGIAIRYPDNGTIQPSDFNGTITLIPVSNSATAEMLLKVGD